MGDSSSSQSNTTLTTCNDKSRTFRIPSHGDSILAALNNQRDSGEFCDITVVVDHHRFSAHKCVLTANSPYLQSLLSNGNDGLFLRQITAESFKAILDFMYTSRLKVKPSNIQDVLCAAKILQVKSVISICCRYLESQIQDIANSLSEKKYKPKHQARVSVESDDLPPSNISSYDYSPSLPPRQINYPVSFPQLQNHVDRIGRPSNGLGNMIMQPGNAAYPSMYSNPLVPPMISKPQFMPDYHKDLVLQQQHEQLLPVRNCNSVNGMDYHDPFFSPRYQDGRIPLFPTHNEGINRDRENPRFNSTNSRAMRNRMNYNRSLVPRKVYDSGRPWDSKWESNKYLKWISSLIYSFMLHVQYVNREFFVMYRIVINV